MDSIPHSEITKPACGEGQRRVRTSAAAIGLAISMGAATMALSKPSNASVVSEPSNETRNAADEQQPETPSIEAPSDEVGEASADGLASALMVPSIDKTAVIPEETSTSAPLASDTAKGVDAANAPTAPAETQYIQYTVRHNQTLWQIADAYQVSLEAIAQANGISADASLSVGQVLDIPVQEGMNRRPEFDVLADANEFTANRKTLEKAIDVRDFSHDDHDQSPSASIGVTGATGATEHIAYIAPLLEDSSLEGNGDFNSSAHDTTQSPIAAVPRPFRTLSSRLTPGFEDLAPQSETALVPSVLNTRVSNVHRVALGETLSSVASRHGVSLDALIAANNLTNPDRLLPGQELVLPAVSGNVYGSLAALPHQGVTAETGVIAPTTPRVAAPASRIAAVSRRDQSLEQRTDRPVSSTTTIAPRVTAQPTLVQPTTAQPTIALATPVTAAETQSVDYAASLRGEIERLRSQTPARAVLETRESTEIAAIPTTFNVNRDSAPSLKPTPARAMASLRVNPEFSARDSVREAASAASVLEKPMLQDTAQDGELSGVVVTPSPAPLVASRDTGAIDTADTVAVAPLGSSNYAPVLPPRSVSPDIPALAAVGEYLPSAKTPMGEFNGYVWPAQGVLTSGYGWRWGRMHNGIDIGAPTGTPIVAAAPGVVTYARWNSGGYGNLVEVTHPDGSLTLYAHNNRIVVEEGDQVEQGQHIADMGSTGFSTGPHLHFELHSAGQGVVNPVAYLP
jgi:murein DD-endopeptidase MepM/ murein hydrolase activator NlpD